MEAKRRSTAFAIAMGRLGLDGPRRMGRTQKDGQSNRDLDVDLDIVLRWILGPPHLLPWSIRPEAPFRRVGSVRKNLIRVLLCGTIWVTL
eukprot:scaffold126_cov315-Pavlova_lutheri.AAC.46